jgi:glycosyltransferase involved in cell wall biosynthesis
MKLVSIVSGTFNEEGNVQAFYDRVRAVMESLPDYRWELIVIDNCSRDGTVSILRRIAAADRRVRVIVNTRNFGAIRSIYHAFLQAYGDAVVIIASDLQEPPELIPEFIGKWEQGYKVALGIRSGSRESTLMQAIRSLYYTIVNRLSDIELHRHATGFGLYDQKVLEILRKIDDPFPYLRGLVCDIGYERALVPFVQPKRQHGRTSNNLYSLYDLAMLGITNHSKVPLRIATFSGFLVGALSLACAFGYLAYKLLYWDRFEVGMAPAAIGIFFFGGVQLFFVGIMGEYILAIHTQVQKRPLVVERERINFEEPAAGPEN